MLSYVAKEARRTHNGSYYISVLQRTLSKLFWHHHGDTEWSWGLHPTQTKRSPLEEKKRSPLAKTSNDANWLTSLIGKALPRLGGGGYMTSTQWRCAGEGRGGPWYATRYTTPTRAGRTRAMLHCDASMTRRWCLGLLSSAPLMRRSTTTTTKTTAMIVHRAGRDCVRPRGGWCEGLARNATEAQILELRLAHSGCHGNLLLSTDEFTVYLNGADGWLFLDECNNVMPEEMESQRDESRPEDVHGVLRNAGQRFWWKIRTTPTSFSQSETTHVQVCQGPEPRHKAIRHVPRRGGGAKRIIYCCTWTSPLCVNFCLENN